MSEFADDNGDHSTGADSEGDDEILRSAFSVLIEHRLPVSLLPSLTDKPGWDEMKTECGLSLGQSMALRKYIDKQVSPPAAARGEK
jgi:hypothetical protein